METSDNYPDKRQQNKKFILGAVVIFAGLLLLLANLGIVTHEFKRIIFSWQMILIGIGVISLFSSESRIPGTILIVIGGVFLLPRVFDLPFNVWHLFWPMILIGLGILILTKRIPHPGKPYRRTLPGQQYTDDGFIHEDHIFSGGKQRISHQVFKGGSINCIFGGTEVDLTQASLAEGVNELEVTAVFGGVTLIVPADWKIQLKTTSILGGFADKRAYVKENTDPNRMLVIKGSTIFGGGEIKSY